MKYKTYGRGDKKRTASEVSKEFTDLVIKTMANVYNMTEDELERTFGENEKQKQKKIPEVKEDFKYSYEMSDAEKPKTKDGWMKAMASVYKVMCQKVEAEILDGANLSKHAASYVINLLKAEDGMYARDDFELVMQELRKVAELNGKDFDIRLQKADIANPVSERETAMRDAVVNTMREAGLDVITDAEEGQRVLDGAKNYVIFNEKDAEITDHVRFFRTASGEAYGFTVGGKIYIDPRIATS